MMEFNMVDNSNPLIDSEFLLKLRNIYSAENYCFRRIPGLLKKIPDNRLHNLLTEHLPIIIERKKRIENIFNQINVKTSGAVCITFKTLISKAGNSIYHIKPKQNHVTYDLLSTLIEISIYRCSIYNFLNQHIANVQKPVLTNALKRCLSEEDDFFHSLLKIKKSMASAESIFSTSLLQPA